MDSLTNTIITLLFFWSVIIYVYKGGLIPFNACAF